MCRGCFRLLCMFIIIAIAGINTGCRYNSADKRIKTADTQAEQSVDTAAAVVDDKAGMPDSVEVVMYLPGDAPLDMPLVSEELSSRMTKSLNCTLKIVNIPWSDWGQKYSLILSAGENYDLIYTSNWSGYKEYVQRGAFMAIDDLLPRYAPDIMNQIEPAGWEEAKWQGKIYAVPARQTAFLTDAWVIRGDLRQKYGVPDVVDHATMEVYLDAVKLNEKNLIPLNVAPGDDLQFSTTTEYEYIPGAAAMLVAKNYNELTNIMWEIETPEYLEFLMMAKRWNDKGFWSRNVLTNRVMSMDAIVEGKSAAASMNTGQAKSVIERIESTHPEWKPEFVCFRYMNKTGVHPMVWMADAMAVGRNSRNPGKALAVLNKIRSDRECYDLLFYGIKGRNYEITTDGMIALPSGVTADKNWYVPETAGQWGMKVQEFTLRGRDEWMDYYDVVMKKLYEFATPDKLAGFIFKSDRVKSELAVINQISGQYSIPLRYGRVENPEMALKDILERMRNAGCDKIKIEMKEQLETYCREKGYK